MVIDLVRLNNNLVDRININESYSFNEEQLQNTEIKKLDGVSIIGYIEKDSLGDYNIFLTIKGIMVLPCSLTLKPVPYPFTIEIKGSLSEILAEIDKKIKKVENTIDILPIIWENILMEIPMKVVSEDTKDLKLEGKGWKLITEEEEKKEVNPELSKLKDLL